MVWTVTGHPPGVFPRSEVFEPPTVRLGSARAANLAFQAKFDAVDEDVADVKPIPAHVHSGQAPHILDGWVGGQGDLAGKKLLTPSRPSA